MDGDHKDIEVKSPPIKPRTVEREDRTRHPIALVVIGAFIAMVMVVLIAAILMPAASENIRTVTKDLMVYYVPVVMLILGFYFGKRK